MLSQLKQQLNRAGVLTINIKVTPKSGKHEVSGIMADGTLKARLRSAPEQGKANEELIELLSETFEVPYSRISVKKGEHTSRKTVVIVKS